MLDICEDYARIMLDFCKVYARIMLDFLRIMLENFTKCTLLITKGKLTIKIVEMRNVRIQ